MPGGLPAIGSRDLMRLLENDGWTRGRETRHGVAFQKQFDDGPRVTIIPDGRKSLASGTLRAILGPKQTGLGRKGLLRLLEEH